MNILILSWRGAGHPNAGGAEQVTLEHAKAWVKKNHDVYIFTSYFKGAKRAELVDGVNIIRYGEQAFGVKFKAFIWYLFKKHPKFDLVIDEFHGIPFFTPLYIKVKKLAFIHEVAGGVWKLNPWPKPLNLIPYIIGTVFEPYIFKILYKNAQFMTVSESTRGDLIRWGISKKNITIIHNGVKLDLPKKLPAKEARKAALYFGALSTDKGIFDALEVFSQVNRKDEDWQFWVAGLGTKEYINNIKRKAVQLNINHKFKYWGYVSDKKKFELMSKAFILINPSVHEGWGLVNIEANSVGTPVVGYDVSGVRDSVINGKTGILVEPGNYKMIAENLLKLSKDPDLYKGYVSNCRRWASKFSWEKSTKESLDFIESL